MEDFERSKEFLMKKFDELLNIPSCRDYLELCSREVESKFQLHIKMYKRLKQSFKELAYGEMEVCEEHDSRRHSTYRFDLRLCTSGHWMVDQIEPELPENIEQQEILSRDLILTLAKFPTNPERIETVDGYFDTSEGKRRFHVQFTRYEFDFIMGAIRVGLPTQDAVSVEIKSERELSQSEQKVLEFPLVEWHNEYKRRCDQENYDKLIVSMMGSDKIKEAIFNYFFNCINPLKGIELL